MMKQLFVLLGLIGPAKLLYAQELYVNTEPASNMATNSLGIRAEGQFFKNSGLRSRSTIELMYGASKNLMLHTSVYASDCNTPNQHFEGASAYAKYRFLSIDSVQKHFRGAFFAKASTINNHIYNQEISLEGDNSGLQGGLVFTQLLHKLAVSASGSYLRAFNNRGGHYIPAAQAKDAVAYTLSAGYLLLPKTYKDYNQVNCNLYLELLGKSNPGYAQGYLDAAPAIQLIFNSVFRVDVSYRTPLYDQMTRNSKNMFLLRLEYNLFNVF